jgi:hypothetical protein
MWQLSRAQPVIVQCGALALQRRLWHAGPFTAYSRVQLPVLIRATTGPPYGRTVMALAVLAHQPCSSERE